MTKHLHGWSDENLRGSFWKILDDSRAPQWRISRYQPHRPFHLNVVWLSALTLCIGRFSRFGDSILATSEQAEVARRQLSSMPSLLVESNLLFRRHSGAGIAVALLLLQSLEQIPATSPPPPGQGSQRPRPTRTQIRRRTQPRPSARHRPQTRPSARHRPPTTRRPRPSAPATTDGPT